MPSTVIFSKMALFNEPVRPSVHVLVHIAAALTRCLFRRIKYGCHVVSEENDGSYPRIFLTELPPCKTLLVAVLDGGGSIAPQFIEISPRGERELANRADRNGRETFPSYCYPGKTRKSPTRETRETTLRYWNDSGCAIRMSPGCDASQFLRPRCKKSWIDPENRVNVLPSRIFKHFYIRITFLLMFEDNFLSVQSISKRTIAD